MVLERSPITIFWRDHAPFPHFRAESVQHQCVAQAIEFHPIWSWKITVMRIQHLGHKMWNLNGGFYYYLFNHFSAQCVNSQLGFFMSSRVLLLKDFTLRLKIDLPICEIFCTKNSIVHLQYNFKYKRFLL